MKVIVAGSRTINDKDIVRGAINSFRQRHDITEIVSGGARGVDTVASYIAAEMNIPFKLFPALWDEHGKSAGFIRNNHMADYADALIVIWDGISKGSEHMKECMQLRNKPILKITLWESKI